jgi:hypothetical protein
MDGFTVHAYPSRRIKLSPRLGIPMGRRVHISAYLTRQGLPHRDRYDCAVYDAARAAARHRGDKRLLRLLGDDADFQAREEEAWAWLRQRDAAAL